MVSSTALLVASSKNMQGIDWGMGCCVMESWSWYVKGTSGQNLSKQEKWHETMKLTWSTKYKIHMIYTVERSSCHILGPRLLNICLGRFSSEGAMHLAKCRAPHFYQMGLHGSIILEHSWAYDALVPDCVMMHNRVKIVHTFVMTQSSICSYTICPTFGVRV